MRLLPEAASWLRDLMLFAIHTGMCMGEILGLTWAGVDLFRRTVMVFKIEEWRTTHHPAQSDRARPAEAQGWKPFVDTELVFPSEAQTRLNASNISRSLHLRSGESQDDRFPFP